MAASSLATLNPCIGGEQHLPLSSSPSSRVPPRPRRAHTAALAHAGPHTHARSTSSSRPPCLPSSELAATPPFPPVRPASVRPRPRHPRPAAAAPGRACSGRRSPHPHAATTCAGAPSALPSCSRAPLRLARPGAHRRPMPLLPHRPTSLAEATASPRRAGRRPPPAPPVALFGCTGAHARPVTR